MKNFELDDQYICSVTIRKEWGMFDHKKDLTEDDLVKVLKGEDRCSSTSCEDHPEFDKLRKQLDQEGYISIWYSVWNGDTVLKPFTLNGVKFKKGEKFCCGAAMSTHLKYEKKKINVKRKSKDTGK